jgi:uncharacterized protein (TIGR04222 family)
MGSLNPFDLAGPSFLLFYSLLATVVIAALWWRILGGSEVPNVRMSRLTADPYRIACLRAGEAEAIRVAVFNLADRGLIKVINQKLYRSRPDAGDLVDRPLDRAILAECGKSPSFSDLKESIAVMQQASAYARQLAETGLMAGEAETKARRQLKNAAVGLLAGVAVTKIAIALARGHSNVALLVILAFVFCGVAARVASAPTTPGGRAMLSNLKTITARLKRNATKLRPGGATNDALLLASVHGFGALPAAAFPLVKILYWSDQRNFSDRDWGFSSSCGSGCGSGCGGGGGCGGCGS